MKISVILGHPNPGSYNHAIAETVCRSLRESGHTVRFHDLYAERFAPVLEQPEITASEAELPDDIRRYIDELKDSEGIVFVHPNWWGGPPAILRGWLDRVFRQGFAYSFTAKGPVPHFSDKVVQIFSTSNTPREVELNVYGDPLENFWKVIVFGLCGSKSFERRNFESIVMSTPEARVQWLGEVEETLKRRFV